MTYARSRGFRFEIIAVNDGSIDDTRERAEALQSTVPELRLVNHPTNRGYGEALRSGFNAATKEWIFLMDADGQFDISELDRFLPATADTDALLGYRANRADTIVRAAFTSAYSLFIWTLFRLRVRDVGCAFKLFRRSAWLAAQPISSKDHKIFTVEWLRNMQRKGLRMNELPVTHYSRTTGHPTGARLDVIWATLKALVALRLR